MRAVKILTQALGSFLVCIHRKRLDTLFWAVQTLLHGNRLSLTGIGRADLGDAIVKHSIKRADRLLGNKHLHRETNLFFHAIAMTLIRAKTRPVILVDWTTTGLHHEALVAALPMDGRAIPIYAEVHGLQSSYKAKVHRDFLRNLHSILPTNCRPIIVTDAGFKTPWFREVRSWNWDFVGRIMGSYMLRCTNTKNWLSVRDVYQMAKLKARDLGKWYIAKSSELPARLILAGKPRRQTVVYGGTRARKGRIRANVPWLLATSLEEASVQRLVSLYSKRMQIEETFRDAKSHRFGWSLVHAQSTTCARIRLLLLIATLGMLALTLFGIAAESRRLHLNYQANRPKRKRRVLSLFFLGRNIVLSRSDGTFSKEELLSAFISAGRRLLCYEDC